jgi:hypothetical protein
MGYTKSICNGCSFWGAINWNNACAYILKRGSVERVIYTDVLSTVPRAIFHAVQTNLFHLNFSAAAFYLVVLFRLFSNFSENICKNSPVIRVSYADVFRSLLRNSSFDRLQSASGFFLECLLSLSRSLCSSHETTLAAGCLPWCTLFKAAHLCSALYE